MVLALAAQALPASKPPVRGKRGMVASDDEYASRVGIEILKKGGNAVDAAVAVGFALAVTYPEAGNLGGGGFMLIRLAKTGDVLAIDYREKAPRKANRNMYLDKNGQMIEGASTIGYLSVGVPGSVAGLALALEKFGTMTLAEVIQPSIELAEKGFVVSDALSQSLKESHPLLSRFPESDRIFLRNGTYYEEGELFVQKELAETLRKIAKGGAKAFYEGEIADLIVDDMRRNGGLITHEDLISYQPVIRKPLKGSYRSYEIYSMPPPSSGGVALIEMLNILEGYPLERYGQNASRTLHVIIEAMRRVFQDRARFLGDSDFVKVPTSGLTSKKYAERLRNTIDLSHATESKRLGFGKPFAYESSSTTHFSIIDPWGNAVANTYTLNESYGSGATVAGAGFLLNDEMDDFAAKPGVPNLFGLIHGEANTIAPSKRPLSAMTPTIITKDGKLFMALGSPGGPRIINAVLQVILNVVDFKLTIQEAIDAPRVHHQWLPDTVYVEKVGFPADVLNALKAKGHRIQYREKGGIGDVQAILIDPEQGIRLGASDPRRNGKTLAY